MNKKILAIITCLAMLISGFSMFAYAATVEVDIDLSGLFDDEPLPEEDDGEEEKNEGEDNKDDGKDTGSNKNSGTGSKTPSTEKTEDKAEDVDLLAAIEKLYEGIGEEKVPWVP